MVFNVSEELRKLQDSPVLTRSNFSSRYDGSFNKYDRNFNKFDKNFSKYDKNFNRFDTSWNSWNNNYKSDLNLNNKYDNYKSDYWKYGPSKVEDFKYDGYKSDYWKNDNYKSDYLKNEPWKSDYNENFRFNNYKSDWRNEYLDDNLFEVPNYLKSIDAYSRSPLKNGYNSPLKYPLSPPRHSFSSPYKPNYTTNRINNSELLGNHSCFNTSPLRTTRQLDSSENFYTPNRNLSIYDSKLRRIKENLNSINFEDTNFDDFKTLDPTIASHRRSFGERSTRYNPGSLSSGVDPADIDELYTRAKELKYKLLMLKES